MRILLVYPDVGIHVNYPVGLGMISAVLQSVGHETRIIHINEEIGRPLDYPGIERHLEDFSPDLVGFSATTNQFKYVKEISAFLKKNGDIPVVCGGIHATIDPGNVLSDGHVDFALRGEGENAVLDLATALVRGTGYKDIPNLASMENGNVRANPLGRLVRDLDALPTPDRKGFEFQKIIDRKNGWVNVMVGRGCPYRCTYCVNNYLHGAYRNGASDGWRVRFRSVGKAIDEIEEVLNTYDRVRTINFDDDIFTTDREWLREFADAYRSRIALPFVCNTRANLLDSETAKLLASAGCKELKIGIESGSERVRAKILKRSISEDTIRRAYRAAEEAGIRTWSFNMVGIPTETGDEIMETVRLNAGIRPYIMRCSIFYPYKGTELHAYCERNGLIAEGRQEAFSNHFDGSILDLPGLSSTEILQWKSLFKWLVDAESDIEVAPFYKSLVEYFRAIPQPYWENGEAKKLVDEMDAAVDQLFRLLKKEHYANRKHLNLNFTRKLDFELP